MSAPLTAEALGPTVIYESEIEEQSKTTDIILRAQRSVTVGTSQFSYTASGNASGETAGQLTLAEGSSLLIETRNLGAGEGGASAGIDLVPAAGMAQVCASSPRATAASRCRPATAMAAPSATSAPTSSCRCCGRQTAAY